MQSLEQNKDDSAENPTDLDALLMLEVAAEKEHALRILIEKWKNPLINFFYRSLSDKHTAEDLAQKTFINLYRARHTYEPRSKFSTYIFHIARGVLINEYRRSTRKPATATAPSEMPNIAAKDDTASLAELEEIFEKTLLTLPENQRTAILLLKQQQLSYEEIAELMQTKTSSVKTWIFRARTTLKEALKNS